MNFPVMVEQLSRGYRASVVGSPILQAEGPTRNDAVRALQGELDNRTARGEIVWMSTKTAVADSFGSLPYADDWKAIVEEAYRLRDEQKQTEFPDDGV